MSEIISTTKELNEKVKPMVLWCHKELNGAVGTYPYRKISDEVQRIIQDHGIDTVEVHRIRSAKVSMAGNQRRLPNGNVVWLNKKAPEPWKPTDTLFSLNYPYSWDEALFTKICRYFASIPNMNGRWEVKVVDKEIQTNWSLSANEATYEFLSDHWDIIPDCDPMFLSECTADEVKEWLLDAYEWTQRDLKTEKATYNPSRPKWLYIEEDKVIQCFYEKSEMAQYIYTSNTSKKGLVKLVYEADWSKEDLSTSDSKTAKEFLALYEQFNPLFPPRDKEVSKRIRQTRYIMGGEKCAAKDLWERSYRSQIDFLIRSGSENHIAALVLMMPCMEMVYKLKTGKTKPDWVRTLKMFFPAIGFEHRTYQQLANLIRNGFVHDGYTKGHVGLNSTHHTPEEYKDSEQVFQGFRTEAGQFKLLIIPAFFWARVRNKIDTFYKYEQWIPGWDMPEVLEISHYIKPLTREEIT